MNEKYKTSLNITLVDLCVYVSMRLYDYLYLSSVFQFPAKIIYIFKGSVCNFNFSSVLFSD